MLYTVGLDAWSVIDAPTKDFKTASTRSVKSFGRRRKDLDYAQWSIWMC